MTITYNYLRFPLSSSLPALIYSDSFSSPTNIKNTDETQEYLVFIFSRYAQKQFCGGIGAFPFGWRRRAERPFRPRRCGLSAAIPNVGERGFTFWIHFSEYGLFPPQRPLPTTPAGCMVGSGRRGGKDKRNTFARTVQKSSSVVCPAAA